MNKIILIAFLLVTLPTFAADSQWVLKQSTLTYHVSHHCMSPRCERCGARQGRLPRRTVRFLDCGKL